MNRGQTLLGRAPGGPFRENAPVPFSPVSKNLLQFSGFDQPLAVEIDGAGVVLPAAGIEPTAMNQIAVGIELAEERVGDGHFPDIALNRLPVFDRFRPRDLDLFARRRLVDDALGVGVAAAWRVDAFAVDALADGDRIARLVPTRRRVGWSAAGAAAVPGLPSLPPVATKNSVACAAPVASSSAIAAIASGSLTSFLLVGCW